jgi:hypothetical protein
MPQLPNDTIEHFGDSGSVFTGKGIEVYRALVVANALRLYARTGLKVNRAYTPTAMLRTASIMTGRKFKRGQYLEAADALEAEATRLRGQCVESRR